MYIEREREGEREREITKTKTYTTLGPIYYKYTKEPPNACSINFHTSALLLF